MIRIQQFQIDTDFKTLKIPGITRVVDVAIEDDKIQAWAEVLLGGPTKTVEFKVLRQKGFTTVPLEQYWMYGGRVAKADRYGYAHDSEAVHLFYRIIA